MTGFATACIDPRFPYPQEDTPDLNVWPVVDETSVSPPPGPAPVEANIGAGCQQQVFFPGSVRDRDLVPGAQLRYRWHLTVQIENQTFGPTFLQEGAFENVEDAIGAEFEVPQFELTYEMLNAKFLGQVPSLVGRTHLLEFHITDGAFVGDSFDTAPETAGVDAVYWWVELKQDICQ